MKHNSASGPDEVKPKPLKEVSGVVAVPLAHICNLIMTTGEFPDKMKQARVSALHKGGSFDDLNNYRPISILSIFSKIAEHIINKRITGFLNTHNIITKEQYGFCKNKSVETALLGIKEEILENIENKLYTLGIFLDFRKAFDCVQHELLLRKLPFYGIRGIALHLIQSYLTSRSQFTVINKVESEMETIKYGSTSGIYSRTCTIFTLYK